MPRNIDAVALVFIVALVLFCGFVADHEPLCVIHSTRVRVLHEHDMRIIMPPPPAAPRMPAMPQMPTMPQLPRL